MLLLLINKFLWKLLVDINGTDKMYLFDYYGFISVPMYFRTFGDSYIIRIECKIRNELTR